MCQLCQCVNYYIIMELTNWHDVNHLIKCTVKKSHIVLIRDKKHIRYIRTVFPTGHASICGGVVLSSFLILPKWENDRPPPTVCHRQRKEHPQSHINIREDWLQAKLQSGFSMFEGDLSVSANMKDRNCWHVKHAVPPMGRTGSWEVATSYSECFKHQPLNIYIHAVHEFLDSSDSFKTPHELYGCSQL